MSKAFDSELDKYDDNYFKQLENNYRKQTRWSRNRIKNVLELIDSKSEDIILDLGCAMGTFAIEFSKIGKMIVGVDFSEIALASAVQLVKKFGNEEKVFFILGKSQYIPIKSVTFDKVICADFVEHLYPNDYLVTIKEIYRILKGGGKVFLYTPNKKHIFDRLREKNIILNKFDSHVDVKTPEYLVQTLSKAGFIIEKLYFKESHVFLFDKVEKILSKIPFIGDLFKRRICIVARKLL